jgi:multisubunit Na+/H+ antiporter MnhG subunit
MLTRLVTHTSRRPRRLVKIHEIFGICNHVMNSLGVGHTEDVYHRAISEVGHTCTAVLILFGCIEMSSTLQND